jgi:twitching motility protein PilT
MGSNLRSRETILLGEAENRHFDDIIEAGSVSGWHTFEQSLVKAYEQDLITEETALLYSNNKMKMIQRLDTLNKPRQGAHSGDSLMSNLRMQEEEKMKLRNKFKPK